MHTYFLTENYSSLKLLLYLYLILVFWYYSPWSHTWLPCTSIGLNTCPLYVCVKTVVVVTPWTYPYLTVSLDMSLMLHDGGKGSRVSRPDSGCHTSRHTPLSPQTLGLPLTTISVITSTLVFYNLQKQGVLDLISPLSWFLLIFKIKVAY